MAVVAKVPLERLADPTDTAYIPRPEWYFLFLFQFLKLFKGSLEMVGSVVLPGLAVLALFLVPFIDRGPVIRLGKRTFAITFVLLAAIAWTGLTTAAVVTTPKNQESAEDIETPSTETPEAAAVPTSATPNPETTAPNPGTLAAWRRRPPRNWLAWEPSRSKAAPVAMPWVAAKTPSAPISPNCPPTTAVLLGWFPISRTLRR